VVGDGGEGDGGLGGGGEGEGGSVDGGEGGEGVGDGGEGGEGVGDGGEGDGGVGEGGVGDGGSEDGGEGGEGVGDGGEGDGGEGDGTVTTPILAGRVIVEIESATLRVVADSVIRTVWYWTIKVLTVAITVFRITILACIETISVALQV